MSFNTIAPANFMIRQYDAVDQGWANFSYGGPHLKKMLQPRAAHSHYKIEKFTLCVKKHIFILNTVFVFHTWVPWGAVMVFIRTERSGRSRPLLQKCRKAAPPKKCRREVSTAVVLNQGGFDEVVSRVRWTLDP